jgi:DNA-binding MarR family transcriptional regulator
VGDRQDVSLEVQRLAANLYEAASAMRHSGQAIARRVGQSQARWQVLWVAGSGAHTVPVIGRRLGLTRQSVQRIANALVADGLATFAANPHHTRSSLFVLTPAGRQVLDEINDAAAERHRQIAGVLGADAVTQLRLLLGRLTAALTAPPA